MNLVNEAWAAHAAGDAGAVALFARARDAHPDLPNLLIGEAEARLSAGKAEPLRFLATAVSHNPGWVEGQSALASLRWESGARERFAEGFRSGLSIQPYNAALWNGYIAALAGAHCFAEAADAAKEARRYFDVPLLYLIEANHAGMTGDDTRVDALLDQVPRDLPDRWPVEARHSIRMKRLDRAAALLDQLRNVAPDDLSNWALTEIVWRSTDDPRSSWLSDQPGLVQQIPLPLESEQRDDLTELLRSFHGHKSASLGQSVRGGTQTRGRLFDRHEPPIRQLLELVTDAIDRYRAGLPPADEAHPLLRHRNRSMKPDGGWSVRLTDAGFHVPHLHPAGILSSACYIVVPPLDRATREGWLELGRPPADLRLDLEPIAAIEPRPGLLALFPSYLYHGTRPFRAGERLSVAFDAR